MADGFYIVRVRDGYVTDFNHKNGNETAYRTVLRPDDAQLFSRVGSVRVALDIGNGATAFNLTASGRLRRVSRNIIQAEIERRAANLARWDTLMNGAAKS